MKEYVASNDPAVRNVWKQSSDDITSLAGACTVCLCLQLWRAACWAVARVWQDLSAAYVLLVCDLGNSVSHGAPGATRPQVAFNRMQQQTLNQAHYDSTDQRNV